MWDVYTDGSIVIIELVTKVAPIAGADPTYKLKPIDKSKFTADERKQAGLDN